MIEIASSLLPLHLQNLPPKDPFSSLSRQAVRVGMADDGEQHGIVNSKEYLKWNNIKIQLAIRPHGILGCERGCLLMERELKVCFHNPSAPYQLIN